MDYALIAIIFTFMSFIALIFRFGKASVGRIDLDETNKNIENTRKDLELKLSNKADKDIFEEFQAEVWHAIEAHEFGNDSKFNMIRDDFKDSAKKQAEIVILLTSISRDIGVTKNDIDWLKHNAKNCN